ncbi:MAG: transcription elongation factor GreA [Bdellovibrionota bacterium]
MKFIMTPRGSKMLRSELSRLKAMRPELANAIEIARGHGDLSENADYDAAKEKSGMVEARIREIEAKVALAEVIDPREIVLNDRVVFGATANIVDIDTDEERTLCIVGIDEADADKGLISYESPLGRALIGKEIGDIVKIKLPQGERTYEVLDVYIDYNDEEDDDKEEGDKEGDKENTSKEDNE